MEWSIGTELFWLSAFIGAITVAVLYERSALFRYRFKFAFYILYFSSVALFMIPFYLLRPKNVKNALWAVPFLKPLSGLLGINWEVNGRDILAKDFPCVIISNHQSMLDVLVLVELWETMKKCATVSKKEIFYVFPFGLMAWLCGTIYINRRNPNESHTTITTSAEKIQKEKTKMWIFPEGTRSKINELLPFRKGAFHIAMTHKLPIVPVVVSPYWFIDDNKPCFDSGTMKMKILNPIDTSSLRYPEDLPKLVENCHELMNIEFKKMKEEMKTEAEAQANNNGISYISTSKASNGHANGCAKKPLDSEKTETAVSSSS